jgi:hypothetical protein
MNEEQFIAEVKSLAELDFRRGRPEGHKRHARDTQREAGRGRALGPRSPAAA